MATDTIFDMSFTEWWRILHNMVCPNCMKPQEHVVDPTWGRQEDGWLSMAWRDHSRVNGNLQDVSLCRQKHNVVTVDIW